MVLQSTRFTCQVRHRIGCGLLPHSFHPYPDVNQGGIVSAALSITTSLRHLPVRKRGALYCPDFPTCQWRVDGTVWDKGTAENSFECLYVFLLAVPRLYRTYENPDIRFSFRLKFKFFHPIRVGLSAISFCFSAWGCKSWQELPSVALPRHSPKKNAKNQKGYRFHPSQKFTSQYLRITV